MEALGNHLDELYSDWPDYESEGPVEFGDYDLRRFRVADLKELEETLDGTKSHPDDHFSFEEVWEEDEE